MTEPVTAVDLASIPIWRYQPADECEHGATLTGPIRIVEPIPYDPTHVRETGRSTEPLTYCLVCHQLAPTLED